MDTKFRASLFFLLLDMLCPTPGGKIAFLATILAGTIADETDEPLAFLDQQVLARMRDLIGERVRSRNGAVPEGGK
jgi:hypothetical protein